MGSCIQPASAFLTNCGSLSSLKQSRLPQSIRSARHDKPACFLRDARGLLHATQYGTLPGAMPVRPEVSRGELLTAWRGRPWSEWCPQSCGRQTRGSGAAAR